MEISSQGKNSVRIKTKNASLVIDPASSVAADVVILTESSSSAAGLEAKLVIEGPGEYEVGGVHINAKKQNSETTYEIFDDQYKILLVPVSSLKGLKEDEDFDA